MKPRNSASRSTAWTWRPVSYTHLDVYKRQAQMTPDQCTLLAGIPNAPSVYDPTVNPDLASQRQRQVLRLMVKYEYLTATEAGDILAA